MQAPGYCSTHLQMKIAFHCDAGECDHHKNSNCTMKGWPPNSLSKMPSKKLLFVPLAADLPGGQPWSWKRRTMRSFDVDMFDLTLVSSKSPESVLPDFGRAGGTEESNRPCLSWVLMLMLMLMLMILPCFAALQRQWSSKMIRDDWPKKCWGSFCLHFRFQVFIHHNPFSGHTHTSNQQTLLTAEFSC